MKAAGRFVRFLTPLPLFALIATFPLPAQDVNPDKLAMFMEQGTILEGKRTTWTRSFAVSDPTQPVSVVLSWHDQSPYSWDGTAKPMNDLNLTVELEARTGLVTWVGNNVDAITGYSKAYVKPGAGTPDHAHFAELVLIDPADLWAKNPVLRVTVYAGALTVDCFDPKGVWPRQDFSLSIVNAVLVP